MNKDFRKAVDDRLSGMTMRHELKENILSKMTQEGEIVVKKRLSLAFVLAMILLITVTSLAAIAVIRSENVKKINLSREALYEKYSLTPKTLGMFIYVGKEENDEYILTWTNNTFHSALTGVYTTVVKDGKAVASWSHDDVDRSVYNSGEFSAPVWGFKQLEASFDNKETAGEYSRTLYRQDLEDGKYDTPYAAPKPLDKGERYWKDEVIREAQPGTNDLTRDQAYDIAVQALADDFGIDKKSIATSVIADESFSIRKNGRTLWNICFYVTLKGVDHECIITLDGVTGEVLSIDVLTGGNG